MSAQHTPGPWYIDRYHNQVLIVDASGNQVANCAPARWTNRDEQVPLAEANARLIAAAPDLLDALKMSESAVEQLCTGQDAANCWVTLATIRAAIAKAVQP